MLQKTASSKEIKLTKCQQIVFEHITEICKRSADYSCYKSIHNIAADCNISSKTANKAKHKLERLGKIKILEFANGKRKNKRHKLELVRKKVTPRRRLYDASGEYQDDVRWDEFERYSAECVNSLPKLDQVDLYVELGLRVVPLHYSDEGNCSCLNTECSKPAKHPAVRWKNYGEENKTSSKFWRKSSEHLKYNIGILLPPDVAIIDVDVRKFGHFTFQYLQEELGALPDTLMTKSGGGGSHSFYLIPKNTKLRSGSDMLGLGVDVLKCGNLVVAASSIHPSGNVYSWTNFCKPVPLPPDYLENLILNSSSTIKEIKKTKSSESGMVKSPAYILPDKIEKNHRTDTLFRYGCYLRGVGGLNQEQIQYALERENHRCVPKLNLVKLKEIAKCAAKYQPNKLKG